MSISLYISQNRKFVISMAILVFMYFIFGFFSWLSSIYVPYFRIVCQLNEFWAYLSSFAFAIAYLVMSIPAGYLLKRIGFKRGIMLGFFIVAAGAFIFVPAAMTRIYWVFLIGLFTMGTGMSILQTAANPYVTIVGPLDRAVQRMSICGTFNKFAGIVSPIIFGWLVLKASDRALFDALPTMTEIAKNVALDELARRMMLPYACLGTLLVGVGLFIRYSVLPEINTEEESEEVAQSHQGKKYIVQFPYLVLGAVAMLMHIGTQAVAIDSIIRYGESMGLNFMDARSFAPYVLSATMLGYIFGMTCIPRVVSQISALRFCTVLGLILSICVIFVPGEVMYKGSQISISIWFLVLIGLPNALIFPGIWPLAIRNLGRFTKIGASLLVMGICGNGVFPLIYGRLADIYGMRPAYWLLIPCFLYLVFYAVHGHKITSWTKKK
jgi:glucose/galactose transporter